MTLPQTIVLGSSDDAEARRSLDEEMRVQQALAVVRVLPAMIVGNSGATLIVALNFLSAAPSQFLAGWLVTVHLLLVPLALRWWRFHGQPAPRRISTRHIRKIDAWSLAMGLVLSVGVIYLFPLNGATGEVLMYLMVVSLACGAMASIWMVPTACLVYAAPPAISLAASIVIYGGIGGAIASLSLGLCTIILLIFLRINFRGFRDGVMAIVERDNKSREIDRRRAAEERLAASLAELQKAQSQLIVQEKMASLGQLTAGIAHEIKNPLNFINNYAEVTVELLEELAETVGRIAADPDPDDKAELDDVMASISGNLTRISDHGRRADSIVRGMLLHSRGDVGERQMADVNDVVEEAINLAYHGARAQDQGFNVTIERDLDPRAGEVSMLPQEITRVLLNLLNNAFYAVRRRDASASSDYNPTVRVSTLRLPTRLRIRVRDNGTGIPADVLSRLFQPFFTTKPAGEGTGLGLSLAWDIVVHQHRGELLVDSTPDEFTEFNVLLPLDGAAAPGTGLAIR
ncbi:MAG: ATP-binding protein [Pseudomonadota bacterium]|nr:ATP-binding protein [Pseudomonadota bacterium]